MPFSTSIPVNKPSSIKLLRKSYELLDVKPETAVCSLDAAKSKCKYIITGVMLRSSIPNRHGCLKNLKNNKETRTDTFDNVYVQILDTHLRIHTTYIINKYKARKRFMA